MPEMFYTPEQAAEILRLNPATVRRQLKRGDLRGVKRGRVWRVPESALSEPTPDSISKPDSWADAAERAAPIYERSLASGGELTAITAASGDFYEVEG